MAACMLCMYVLPASAKEGSKGLLEGVEAGVWGRTCCLPTACTSYYPKEVYSDVALFVDIPRFKMNNTK